MSMNVVCPVFPVDNIKKTLEFYVNKLGFQYADHVENAEKFATIYRDFTEIVLVQMRIPFYSAPPLFRSEATLFKYNLIYSFGGIFSHRFSI